MRILRVLPIAIGMTMAVLSAAPASADSVYSFGGRSEYRDSVSVNSYRRARPSQRVERQERRKNRTARRIRDDDEPRQTRRASRRGARLASLGNDTGSSWSGGGGSHGIASYYWQPQRVASGGWFNPNAMTAAHKTLPFGTKVRVTHAGNGRSVVVSINDRGPYIKGRIIDLSKAAAGVIGMHGQGIARVRMEVLGR